MHEHSIYRQFLFGWQRIKITDNLCSMQDESHEVKHMSITSREGGKELNLQSNRALQTFFS